MKAFAKHMKELKVQGSFKECQAATEGFLSYMVAWLKENEPLAARSIRVLTDAQAMVRASCHDENGFFWEQ